MKKRFDFRSVKSRIWLSFLGFAIVLMVLVWFLQIYFVNRNYVEMKTDRTHNAAEQMLAMLNADQMKEFKTAADSYTQDNDIFVILQIGDKILYPVTPPTGYKEELDEARTRLLEGRGTRRSFTMTKRNEIDQPRTYIYASFLKDSDDAMLFVFSPLYPVRSTIEIMQNQLFYAIGVALILAFLLSYYLSTVITKPITTMTRSAAKLAEGEYGTTFPVGKRAYSEIADLSHTLNTASTELAKTHALQKDIMANVSHDLRTPLTMIKSYAEMIRDLSGDIPEKRNAHLQVIIDESDRLGLLVSDMMALSQLQAGTLQLDPAPFDIKAATESILNPYLLLEADGYTLQLNCDEHYMAIGDEERIKQVISNLLTNAIKYCGEDKVVIINIRRWGRTIHFEVVDHGVGIKPEELDNIWQRYQRSSSNHVRSTGGSGLGLSIVSEILTLHGAKFGVESKVGQGTTMWFELESSGVIPVNIPTQLPTDTLTLPAADVRRAIAERNHEGL